MTAVNPPPRRTQEVPLYRVHEANARTAWDVYAAMRHAERANPKLRKNALWQTLRDDAFGEFCKAFEAIL